MKLSDFSLIHDKQEEERLKSMIERFNQTTTSYPRTQTIHAIFSEHALKTPDALAIISEQDTLTYRDLDRRSNQLAHFLLTFALPTEAVIGLMLDRSPDTLITLLAILKIGAAYLPLNAELPTTRMQYMLNDTQARLLITNRQHQHSVESLLQTSTQSLNVVYLDSEADTLKHYPDTAPPAHGKGDNLAYIMYTSGTTGQPKGVMIEHKSVLRLVLNTDYIDIKPQDRILQTGSLAFDASTFEIWGALLNGATFCCLSEFSLLDAEKLKHFIRDYNVSILFLTTSLFNQLVDRDIALFAPLKHALTGGERVSCHHINKLRSAYPELTIIHCYGPTENTTFSTTYRVEQHYTDDIPIGQPIANTQVLILDANNQFVQMGAAGEICLAGDGLARGYLNDDALTNTKFIRHPFKTGQRLYRTGDLGLWQTDGTIKFIGRKDGQIKIRGYRIELSEIENHLLQHEAVKEAVVIVKELGAESRELWAYATLTTALDSAQLRNYLKARLPDYMIPSYFTVLETLPLNANGKVDKNALPSPDRDLTNSGHYQAPKTETERALQAIWETLLEHQGIGITDNFFDIGGHSLKITKMAAAIQQQFGITLPLSALFAAPTIRQLAETLLNSSAFNCAEADTPMLLLNGVTDGRKLFAFPPGTGDAIGFSQLAGYFKQHSFYSFNFLESDTRIHDYADLITATDPLGPYCLLGYSAGGNLAYHVAYELEQRGFKVSNIIMIDSARLEEPINYPEEAVQQTIDQFIQHDSMTPYLHNSILRDKAARIIRCYHDYLSKTVDDKIVHADIHVLLGDDAQMTYYSDEIEMQPLLIKTERTERRIILSVEGWQKVTTGLSKTYQSQGSHNQLLLEPYLKKTADIIRALIT